MPTIDRLKAKLFTSWTKLNPREQLMVGLMLVFLVGVGGVMGIVMPMQSYIARTKLQVMQLKAQEKTVKMLTQEAKTLKTKPSIPPMSPMSLDPMIRQVLLAQKVNMNKLNMAPDEVGITISGEIGFDQMINAVGQLATQSQIYLQTMQLSPSSQPGVVKITASFAHAGAAR